MARNLAIKHIRTTKANLDSQASASGLNQGEIYLITDEDRIAIGLSATTYETFAKESEANDGTSVVGVNSQTGTTYTLALSDAGKLVRCSNASAITLTVPPNSSVAFPVNTVVTVEQQGAGVITITPGSGVTCNAFDGLLSAGQYAGLSLVKVDTNVWTVFGGVSA